MAPDSCKDFHLTQKRRILLLDQNPFTAELRASCLAKQSDLSPTCLVSVNDGLAAIAATGPFDLVLADFATLGSCKDAFLGLKQLLDANRPGHVALCSGKLVANDLFKVLDLGVRGVLPKMISVNTLPSVIRALCLGEKYVHHSFLASMDADF